jgi:transcriptional regulator with XRE-family HTH domain
MTKKTVILIDVGARLRAERLSLGLNQGAFGEIGDVTRNSQSQYEKGDSPFNIEYLMRLGAAGVDIGYVVTGIRQDGSLGADQEALLAVFDRLHSTQRPVLLQVAEGLARLPQPAKTIDEPMPIPTLHSPKLGYRAEE